MKPFWAFLFLCGAAASGVTISKCCPVTQHMSQDAEHTCIKEKKEVLFKSRVYLNRRGTFLEPGQYPKSWNIREQHRPRCLDDREPKFIAYLQGNFVLFGNGTFYSIEYNEMVHPDKYCVDYSAALVCPEDLTTNKTHIKKCCAENLVYSEVKKSCTIGVKKESTIHLPDGFGFNYAFPVCDKQMAIKGKFTEELLQDDGSLLVNTETIKVEQYCLERIADGTDNTINIFTCHEPLYTMEKHPKERDIRFTLYPIGLALSAVFMAATLIAGLLLPPSHHHVLHWRCQTNHVVCLLIGNVLLCIVQLSDSDGFKGPICFVFAVLMHFFFLSAFFWLNTMCFNIWWTFRDLRPQSLEKSQERWRLRIYHIYAWGVPLMLAGTGAILDNVGESDFLIQPGFSKESCWFVDKKGGLTYFYGPLGGLLIINLFLFGATARELTCGLWKRELVKSTTERAALGRVCLKLVIVMGVTWIADVVSWAVGGPHEIWIITDLINSLQGVFIFIVVALQPQVIAAAKRFWCLRKNRAAETAGTTNHHSSSSQGLPSMGDTITNNSITNGTTKSMPLETSC